MKKHEVIVTEAGVIADARFTRFKEAPWFVKASSREAIIGGAGGIGSWLALMLTRMGTSCYIYDFDSVEEHNIGGQLYGKDHIGLPKVEALMNVMTTLGTSDSLYPQEMAYDDTCPVSSVMFSAFDNMEARKTMFEQWKEATEKDKLFVDGRLGMEHMEIFCVQRGMEADYEASLFKSSEVPDELCTMKQTSHSAAMIASHMAAFYTNWLTNLEEPDTREIPFHWKYFIPLNL